MNIQEHAVQLTAYEKWGNIDFEDYLKDLIQEHIEDTYFFDLIESYNEYLSKNAYEEIYINDEDFFQMFFESPYEAVRATQYGDYKYNDDFVRFNGYGNLESYSLVELEREIKEDTSYIDFILENIEEYELEEINKVIENQEQIIKETLNLVKQGY